MKHWLPQPIVFLTDSGIKKNIPFSCVNKLFLPEPEGGCTLLCDERVYCKYSKSATHLCSVLLQPFILMNTPITAAIFSWTISAWCLTHFLPQCLVCVKRKKYKQCHCISVSSVILGQKRAVFGHICSVKCKWRTSDTVSSFSPPCLLVAKRESWLARQAGAMGSLLCVWRGHGEMRSVNNLPR